MNWYQITVRSVTYAQRAEQALLEAHYRCYIARTPKWMAEKGCGYCVHIQCREISAVLGVLRRNGISWQKVYRNMGGKTAEAVQ